MASRGQVAPVQPQLDTTANIERGSSPVLVMVKVQLTGPSFWLTFPKSCTVLSISKGALRASARRKVSKVFISSAKLQKPPIYQQKRDRRQSP